MFKVKNDIAPEIMDEVFAPEISPCDCHNNNLLQRRRLSSVWHGTDPVSHQGPKNGI